MVFFRDKKLDREMQALGQGTLFGTDPSQRVVSLLVEKRERWNGNQGNTIILRFPQSRPQSASGIHRACVGAKETGICQGHLLDGNLEKGAIATDVRM